MNITRKRVIAYIIDYFVISAVMWILSQILFAISPENASNIYMYSFAIVFPILTLIYFIYLEKNKGETVGKNLMGLKVVSQYNHSISYISAITRNISKIYFVPIIIDLLIGKFTKGDNERILGKISNSLVIEVE